MEHILSLLCIVSLVVVFGGAILVMLTVWRELVRMFRSFVDSK